MAAWAVEIWGKIKGLFEAAFRKISEIVTGIVTFVKETQFEKQQFPKLVKLSGRYTVFKEIHSLKQ